MWKNLSTVPDPLTRMWIPCSRLPDPIYCSSYTMHLLETEMEGPKGHFSGAHHAPPSLSPSLPALDALILQKFTRPQQSRFLYYHHWQKILVIKKGKKVGGEWRRMKKGHPACTKSWQAPRKYTAALTFWFELLAGIPEIQLLTAGAEVLSAQPPTSASRLQKGEMSPAQEASEQMVALHPADDFTRVITTDEGVGKPPCWG